MSFPNRILPPLPLHPHLSNEALERRWSKPDALTSYKIMLDETSNAVSKESEAPKAAPNSSSPAADQTTPSDVDVALEDYESPKYPPPRSTPQEPEPLEESIKTVQPASPRRDSDTWEGESPSSICLCQPEPKVPRPRNGTYPDATDPKSGSHPSVLQRNPQIFRTANASNTYIAFILYRQHNQAAVVAQNRGLANPEVSKIIGEHWRKLSHDDKNHWKLLADVNNPYPNLLHI